MEKEYSPQGFPSFINKNLFQITPYHDKSVNYKNPWNQHSPLETNCALKALLVTVGGYGMGFLLGLFTNAVEMRDLEFGRSKYSTKQTIKNDLRKITGTARGFAIFGFFFSVFECQVEHLRCRDDAMNSFYSGALTSIIVSLNVMGPRGLFFSGIFGGLFGGVMYNVQLF